MPLVGGDEGLVVVGGYWAFGLVGWDWEGMISTIMMVERIVAFEIILNIIVLSSATPTQTLVEKASPALQHM